MAPARTTGATCETQRCKGAPRADPDFWTACAAACAAEGAALLLRKPEFCRGRQTAAEVKEQAQ